MKKFLLAVPAILLIAAGCNAGQQSSVNTGSNSQNSQQESSGANSANQSASTTKPTADVDKLVDTLNAQAQDQANSVMGSDASLFTSDSATLNSYANVQ